MPSKAGRLLALSVPTEAPSFFQKQRNAIHCSLPRCCVVSHHSVPASSLCSVMWAEGQEELEESDKIVSVFCQYPAQQLDQMCWQAAFKMNKLSYA